MTFSAHAKRLARQALRQAVKRGTIIKPKRCDLCLNECKLEGHHDDYSQRLNVEWLCRLCHTIRHFETF